MLIKVAHGGSNLLPECFLFSADRILFYFADVIFQPTAIPMNIEHNIHTVINAITNNRFYSVKPVLIYESSCFVVDMRIPCTWYTNSSKAELFYIFYIRF